MMTSYDNHLGVVIAAVLYSADMAIIACHRTSAAAPDPRPTQLLRTAIVTTCVSLIGFGLYLYLFSDRIWLFLSATTLVAAAFGWAFVLCDFGPKSKMLSPIGQTLLGLGFLSCSAIGVTVLGGLGLAAMVTGLRAERVMRAQETS